MRTFDPAPLRGRTRRRALWASSSESSLEAAEEMLMRLALEEGVPRAAFAAELVRCALVELRSVDLEAEPELVDLAPANTPMVRIWDECLATLGRLPEPPSGAFGRSGFSVASLRDLDAVLSEFLLEVGRPRLVALLAQEVEDVQRREDPVSDPRCQAIRRLRSTLRASVHPSVPSDPGPPSPTRSEGDGTSSASPATRTDSHACPPEAGPRLGHAMGVATGAGGAAAPRGGPQ